MSKPIVIKREGARDKRFEGIDQDFCPLCGKEHK